MGGKIVKIVFLVSMVFLAAACATSRPMMGTYADQPLAVSAALTPKVETLAVLLDASESMARGWEGQPKIQTAMDLLYRMNQTIPNLKLEALLRTFGEGPNPFRTTRLVFGPGAYSRSGFAEGLATVGAAGCNSPLDKGLNGIAQDLEGAQGRIGLVVLSDGLEIGGEALKAARGLRERYGDRLCIYTVLIGDDPDGRNLLDALTRVGTCGMATDAKKLGSAAGMQDFVRTVFFEPAKIVPKPAPVAAKGPKDSDGDGVTDDRDACPGTPPGGRVDANGCWEAGMVHFDFDKADIKPEYTALLDEVARMMQQYSYLKLGIHGHTDNMGPEVYNQHLSVKRAEAVRAYLTAAGVAEWRFAVEGFGLTQPIATNDTREGRAMNRRGEMKQMP